MSNDDMISEEAGPESSDEALPLPSAAPPEAKDMDAANPDTMDSANEEAQVVEAASAESTFAATAPAADIDTISDSADIPDEARYEEAQKETGIFYHEPLWEEGGDLPGALEALFTATGEVLDLARLQELTGIHEGPLRQAIEKLQERLQPPRGLRLVEVAGGWRLATAPQYASLVSKLVTTIRSGRLTPTQIETLAIIAYRQPVTIPEINEIRGVTSCANQVKSLMERELVLPAGRKFVVGRPMTYVTSQKFLVHFGLNSLQDLPRLSDFGEGNLEALALAQLEPPMPADSLFAQIVPDLPEDLVSDQSS